MTPQQERRIGMLLGSDPALRRRLALRAGKEAVRRGLTGPYAFRVDAEGHIIASIAGQDVAVIDPFEGAPRA